MLAIQKVRTSLVTVTVAVPMVEPEASALHQLVIDAAQEGPRQLASALRGFADSIEEGRDGLRLIAAREEVH